MQPEMKSIAIKYGGIMAAIAILYKVIAYIVDPYYLFSPWESTRYLINAVVLIMAMLAFRKVNGGYSSFQETFSAWMLPSIFVIVAVILFKILLFWGIDPDLRERVPEITREVQVNMAKAMGATDGDLAAQSEKLDASITPLTISSLLKEGMTYIIGNAIFGLLFAAAFTKRKPE